MLSLGLCGPFAFAQTMPVTQTATTTAAKQPAAKKKLDTPEGPITTEIYADEAYFDSNKNVGVFTGHVKVIDPRFNLQSDKLTVYLHRGEEQGLDKAVAEGNVGIVRDRPGTEGGSAERAVGRADKAVYTAKDGNAELTGMPKVQQGANMHVAMSPETVMIINQDGQLTTHGPSRTEIRQEPKEQKPTPAPKE
jgi:lipopolysaccharide transport protein LptA